MDLRAHRKHMAGPTVTVRGLGGVFFRTRDPVALARWYEEHFGLPSGPEGGIWMQEAGPTVFAAFDADTSYFGHEAQQFMLNFRVDDLDQVLAALAAKGIAEVKEREEMEGIGRFAWVADPEGNRIELWEPGPVQAPQ